MTATTPLETRSDDLAPARRRSHLALVELDRPTFPWADLGLERRPVDGWRLAPTSTWYSRHGKRVLDVVLSSLLLVLAAPLMALTWLALLGALGRGTVMSQRRCGHLGQDFDLYKFRTMHHSRRARLQPIGVPDRRTTHKSDADPRHTRVGRLVRRFSLDELPQLVNVLRGDMSLVGPRPELSTIADQHGLRSHPRHLVRPGITGEWQISVRSTGALLHETVAADLPYLSRVTLLHDIRVMIRTIGVFLGGGGH